MKIMSVKRVIRLGDKTTHGGEVVSAASDYTIMDKAVAREHDIVTCPIPGHGSGGIIGGDPYWSLHDRAIAIEGLSVAHCGAGLISSCGDLGRSYEGQAEPGAGAASYSPPAVDHSDREIQEGQFDDRYTIKHPETGKLLPNRAYALLLSDGEMRYGTSDASGKTDYVQTGDAPDIVELYIEGV